MGNVQPVLCGGNGKATDLQLVLSESSGSVSVFLGTALLERLRCSPEALQHIALASRLVNAGWRLTELRGAFGHDPRMAKNRCLRAQCLAEFLASSGELGPALSGRP